MRTSFMQYTIMVEFMEHPFSDWNTPGTSSQPTFAPSSPPDKEDKEEVPPQLEAPVQEEWRPPVEVLMKFFGAVSHREM